MQGQAGAVIGQNAPTVQRGRDAAGQHAVWRDERSCFIVFRCFAQAKGDGGCFLLWAGRFDQGHIAAGIRQIFERGPLIQPRICERRGA